jgi:hypothetical protein
MDPDRFSLKPTESEKAQYGEAVLFGYRKMDDLLARFMKLAGEDVTLVFATALGQQPYVDRDSAGGKRLYRPRHFEGLLAFAGVTTPHSVSPVMAEQFHVDLRSDRDADEAERLLRSIRVDGSPLMMVVREHASRLFAGVSIFDEIPQTATVTAEGGRSAPFYELFYRAAMIKSGRHHPDGAFWIRTPERTHRREDGRVSLCAVAPTILDLFGVTPPSSMRVPSLTARAATGTRGPVRARAPA